jgi:hypothetical protein
MDILAALRVSGPVSMQTKQFCNDKLIVHVAQSAPLVWRKIVSHLPQWFILAQPNNMIQLSIFYVSLLRKVRVTCITVLAKN